MPDKTPMQARTLEEIEDLPDGRTSVADGAFGMQLYEDYIDVIAPDGTCVDVPRKLMERFIRWYLTGDPNGKLEVGDA